MNEKKARKHSLRPTSTSETIRVTKGAASSRSCIFELFWIHIFRQDSCVAFFWRHNCAIKAMPSLILKPPNLLKTVWLCQSSRFEALKWFWVITLPQSRQVLKRLPKEIAKRALQATACNENQFRFRMSQDPWVRKTSQKRMLRICVRHPRKGERSKISSDRNVLSDFNYSRF